MTHVSLSLKVSVSPVGEERPEERPVFREALGSNLKLNLNAT